MVDRGVTTGSSLSGSGTPYPPSQAGCSGSHIEISVRAYRERQLPSGCLLQLAICCHMLRCSLSPGHLHMNRLESLLPAPGVQTGRLGVLSCLFSSGLGASFPLFEVGRVALDVLLSVVHLPVPQHVLYATLLICHRSFHTLTSVVWIFFRSAFTRSVTNHRFTLSIVSLFCSCGMV